MKPLGKIMNWGLETRYDPIEEERKWWGNEKKKSKKIRKPLPPRHHFAHSHIRSRLYDTLVTLGCGSNSTILELGCGSGEDAIYTQKTSKNIIGVDIAPTALRRFIIDKGFRGVLANVKKLPFRNDSFDYIISSGLLHHLIGQGDLNDYLDEFVRVTRGGLPYCIRAKFI